MCRRNSARHGRAKYRCTQDKRIEFRIGIHVGDIIIEDDDIFGDGVNIAVRLEGIAEPGLLASPMMFTGKFVAR
jgi:class 3 adenylate cyclase